MYNQMIEASTDSSSVLINFKLIKAKVASLSADITLKARAIVLDNTQSKDAQITKAIAPYAIISGVLITFYQKFRSHQLKTANLCRQILKANYAASLQSWLKALTPDGDIGLYDWMSPLAQEPSLCCTDLYFCHSRL